MLNNILQEPKEKKECRLKPDGFFTLHHTDPYSGLVISELKNNFGRSYRTTRENIRNENIHTYNISGSPVATITIKKENNCIFFMDLLVGKDYRTIGIGSKVMNHYIATYEGNKILLGSKVDTIRWFTLFSFEPLKKVGNIVIMEYVLQHKDFD
jgi:hypothetical protein